MFTGGAMRRRSGSGSGDGGEEADELAELARSIDRAVMPPRVHKVCRHVHGAAYRSMLAGSCSPGPTSDCCYPSDAVLSRWRCGSWRGCSAPASSTQVRPLHRLHGLWKAQIDMDCGKRRSQIYMRCHVFWLCICM